MNTHILIFSCVHDLDYLEYCLRSIEKFATGFTGVTVAVAQHEFHEFVGLTGKWGMENKSFVIKTYDAPADKRFGHIAHQGEKCRADLYVPPGTDLVLFTDSDCVFQSPVTPETYMVDGLPVLLIESYNSMKGSPWQQPTSEIMGRACDFETMRRHPAVHWVGMFKDLRAHVERVQDMEFMPFVMTRKPDFCWGISDFNLMGSFVLHGEWCCKYHLIDLTGGKPHPESTKYLMQFWSHSPMDKEQGTPNGYKLVPLDYCKNLGL